MQKTWLHSTNKLKRRGRWTFFQEKYLHRLKFTQENLVLPQKLATSPQICSFTRKFRKKTCISRDLINKHQRFLWLLKGDRDRFYGLLDRFFVKTRLNFGLFLFDLFRFSLIRSDIISLKNKPSPAFWKIENESITSSPKPKHLWNDSLTIVLSVLQ